MTRASRVRRGVTLIELIVALTIIAIMGAVVLLAPRVSRNAEHGDEALSVLVGEARRTAIATGRPQVVRTQTDVGLIAFPDGSVLADSSLHIDRLSGLPLSARGSR